MPPRLLRPKDETGPDNLDSNDIKSSKRRAVSSACVPCRKRKSKCDGGVPACSTCVAVYNTECTYDADSDHRRKGALKRDIQSLQQRNDALDVIVASLRALPEAEAVSLLHSLRTDTSPDVIAASLRNSVNLAPDHAPPPIETDFVYQRSQESGETSSNPASSVLSPVPQIETNALNPSWWFRNPPDMEFIEHLLELYFSWVHPFHHIVSKEHFLFDFRNGRSDNCCAALANAILAYACHYSDRPAARPINNDPATAGDQFFAEAKMYVDQSDKPSITLMQALGVMSLRETSMARESNGYQYAGRFVRMAIELGLNLKSAGNDETQDVELRKLTFWGVHNHETMSSLGLGRVSMLPRSIVNADKPQIVERIETQPWKAYEDTVSNNTSSIQSSHPMTFLNELIQLCEIANDMVNTFYAPRESFTSRKLAATYIQLQEWYNKLPQVLCLEHTALPHVIVLHMCYHVCTLHLFRPYIKLDLRIANLYPRDACTQAANHISKLMDALRALYGLRRTSVAVVNILLAASTIHMMNLPSQGAANNLTQAMHDLQTMSVNHPHAGRCLEVIRSLGTKWNISLPEDAMMSALQINSSWSSPAASIYYASSIPRKQSSDSRERSQADSNSNPKLESPVVSIDQQSMQDTFDQMSQPTQMPFWSPNMGSLPSRDQSFDFQQNTAPDWATYVAQQEAAMQHHQQPQQGYHGDQQNAQQGSWQYER